MSKQEVIGVRLEDADLAALRKIAAAEDRTVAFLVRKAVSEMLARRKAGIGKAKGRKRDGG